MEGKIYQYYASALSGLEEVVADELQSRLPGLTQLRLERGKRQGRVFFTHRRSPRLLLDLRTPLNLGGILAQVQGITVGQPGLERLLNQLEKVDFQSAQHLLKACEPEADEGRFQLSVTMQGAHRFSKGEVVGQVQGLLERRGLKPGEGLGHLRLQLQVEGQRAVLGMQLGPNRARHCLEEGGIGGPLASCLGHLLPATGNEVLVVMGFSPGGVAELAGSGGRAALIALGSVLSPGTGAQCLAARSQLAFLPLGEGSADLVLAAQPEPPFHPWIAELARILHPGGVAAVLAAESRALAALLQTSGEFAPVAGLPINLKGRPFTLWMLERLEEGEPLLGIEGVEPGG